MKDYGFSEDTFIGGWFIPGSICDDLIQLFKDNKEHHKKGVIGGPFNVNKEKKDSIDMGIHPAYDDPRFKEYTEALKHCVDRYTDKYPEVKEFNKFGMVEGANIQYYPPGGGYFVEHCERTSMMENRCLVWMTYLNEVPEAGTHFKYQDTTAPGMKGLTLIWPTDFTHTHRGVISKTQEKYIITGWMGYVKQPGQSYE